MSNPVFYAGDLEEATYSATSTNSSYPLANLDDYDPDTYWQANNANQNQQLAVDFGSAKARDFAVIHNHNFASVTEDIGIKLQGADDSAFTTNLVTAEDDIGSLAASDPIVIPFSSQTKRYWRIYFESTVSLTVAPKVGQLFINQKLDVGASFEWPYSAKDEEFRTEAGRAISGKLRTSQIHKGVLRFQFRFRLLDDTFRAGWLRFHQKVRGAACPFYYADPDGTVWYVHLADDYNEIEVFRYQLNNTGQIRLESVKVHQNPLS
jgi:hypothetical protein